MEYQIYLYYKTSLKKQNNVLFGFVNKSGILPQKEFYKIEILMTYFKHFEIDLRLFLNSYREYMLIEPNLLFILIKEKAYVD